ncbi:hypothetical protein NDU88_001316 [Pleurodeles waltl]|uniref:Uncharacterized protein n=1 Tax=Pleurodeles waltl TaxID=8319 RepID=A0AAV7SZ49_PLEWA|nr:hypothetical protein NDU88_001316 [Pleurodeles waltl]
MGRAGWFLSLLWCLALGVVRAGTVAETTDEGIPRVSSDTLASSIGPTAAIHLHLSSLPLTGSPNDAGTPQLITGRPAEKEQTEESVLGTQNPVSQAESGIGFRTTVNSTQEDTAAEGQQNSTVISILTPTPEDTSTDLNITVEEVHPTQSHSPAPPGRETGTTGQSTPEMSLLTTPGPASPQANLTEETTQDAVDSGETTQPPMPSRNTITEGVTSIRATTATQSITSKATTVPSVTTSAQTSLNKVASAEGKQEPSVLDVGDDGKDVPGVTNRVFSNTDPLIVAVISVFIVMIGILGLVGFLRYRQRNSRTEFRRLQDLPMDDMMEDTPLSLYSY